ncbi:MAG: class I SAM-dependent methyltransferase [Chloroflexi bacterium]|nr:class I SAM-dependent methyltransferase [Chloroflexota bacterium]
MAPSTPPRREIIELLSVDLLDQHRPLVNRLRNLAKSLNLEFGWHYLLDLVWIINQLGDVKGKHIMDAGAGTGLLQWYLADQGANVISVDRISRAWLPIRFRNRFHVKGLRRQDLEPTASVFQRNFRGPGSPRVRIVRQLQDIIGAMEWRRSPGRVTIYNQDLQNLSDIPSNSLDAVVAVSALEHNSPENLERVVAELMRVLKPGGILAASLVAARDQDWWHEPSSGWCYTENSLRNLFHLPPSTPSNYDRYDAFFQGIRESRELRDHLARFYYQSGNNGMPWGRWDPQYIPVGVCKVKEAVRIEQAKPEIDVFSAGAVVE